jgi:hypothetical protein
LKGNDPMRIFNIVEVIMPIYMKVIEIILAIAMIETIIGTIFEVGR